MKQKRVVSFILALGLMFILSAVPFGVFGNEPDPPVSKEGKPTVDIIGSTIENDDQFFELTMKVVPGENGFSTAGIVLKYDKSVITPVAWDDAGTELLTSETTDWQHVAAIPAVSPTEISGRAALAYEDSSSGYIYLSAESSIPLTNLPNGGKIVTVRFKYYGEEDFAALNKELIVSDFASLVTLADDETAAASPAGQQVFYGTGDADMTEYYYSDTPSDTIGITTSEDLLDAPTFTLMQNQKTANTAGGEVESKAVVFFDWDESTLLGSVVINAASSTADIQSVINEFTKGLLPDDADMTLWETADAAHEDVAAAEKAVEESDEPENAESAENVALAEAKAAEETALAALKEYTTYNKDYPLTSHDGYTFGKWIPFDSEDFTVYGTAAAINGTGTEVIPVPDSPSYDDIGKGLILKAAYISNITLDSLANATKRRYTVSNNRAFDSDYYIRYTADDIYTLKLDIKRVNADSFPVHRMRDSALRVRYKLADKTEIYSLVDLENVDEQQVEVTAPSNVVSVDAAVIDVGGVDNWASGTVTRSEWFSIKSEAESETAGDNDDLGFKKYGNVQYINSQIAIDTVTTLAANFFNDAGFTLSKETVDGATSTGAAALRRQAVTNLKKGRQHKIESENISYLTYEEMKRSIENGDYK